MTKIDSETVVSTVAENEIREEDYQGGIIVQWEYSWWRIIHEWFDYNDIRQQYVNYAYKLWWWDLVYLMECENGNWSIYTRWDSGKAFWLCQMNTNYHKLPEDYYTTWQVQVELCYQKWKEWTKFYWPSRIVKGKRCSEYVKDRFTYIE